MRALTHDRMTITETRPAVAPPRAPAAARAFASVEVHATAAPVLAAWAELERVASASIYQSRAWLLPWIDTLAAPAHLEPRFVLARGTDGRPAALLFLGLRRSGPLRIATWLGSKDANFNMALLAPAAAWTRPELMRLLREARRVLGRMAPDVFVLPNQPLVWDGVANPLAALPHQPSPSAAYGATLPRDARTLFATKLSKDSRKKLRKKESKLAAAGPLAHVIAADAAERTEILDAFLEMRNARFRVQNIASPFEAPEMRDFLAAASGADQAGIELHALKVGARIVAVYGGAAHQGRWSGMFNAFDMDPTIAASSPGDLLLLRIVAKACRDGLARFDLGIGAARYKAALCDETIDLFDAFVPMTTIGRIAAAAIAAKQALKRRVKADLRLFAFAKRVRGRR